MRTPLFASGSRIAAVAVLALATLSGCAATNQFAARVTTFEEWPADAVGQSYRITGAASPEASLEHQNYQDLLRSSLERVGLVEARPWVKDARFTVNFSYESTPFQTWTEVAAPFYGPTFSYGHFGRGWGYGMMFPFGAGPAYSAVPVTAYRYTLNLSILDSTRGNAQVFQGKATHEAGPDALPRVMPYLIEAVFQDFPFGNGQVRTVRIPR